LRGGRERERKKERVDEDETGSVHGLTYIVNDEHQTRKHVDMKDRTKTTYKRKT
jgi:hypothetical protein